jgi:hypothetical protein
MNTKICVIFKVFSEIILLSLRIYENKELNLNIIFNYKKKFKKITLIIGGNPAITGVKSQENFQQCVHAIF